jgi:hypothetical protein
MEEIRAGATVADRSTTERQGPVAAPNLPSTRWIGLSASAMKSRYSALVPGNDPAGNVV